MNTSVTVLGMTGILMVVKVAGAVEEGADDADDPDEDPEDPELPDVAALFEELEEPQAATVATIATLASTLSDHRPALLRLRPAIRLGLAIPDTLPFQKLYSPVFDQPIFAFTK